MEKFIQDIAREAGKIVLEKFGKAKVAYTKKHEADLVTETDLAANTFLIDAIHQKYPEHGIISEEQDATSADAEYVWIIDPIDGTMNFARGFPSFGVMVGLARDKQMELSVIFDPMHDELFFAKRDSGAFLNKVNIDCSARSQFAHSIGCHAAFLNQKDSVRVAQKLASYAEEEPFVMTSSAGPLDITSTANGRRDWYVNTGGGVWDFTMPYLLLAESGCIVTTLDGTPWQFGDTELVAANPHLHPKLIEVLNT